jgi:ATP-dependent protease ClpP protease subunit
MNSSSDNNIDSVLMSIPDSPGKVPRKVLASLYEFYLCGEITGPKDYIEWFDTIRHAQPDDTVKIYINSGGGDLFTGIQFLRVLAETEAHVIVSVEGLCASAATLVFLSADSFELTPHSSFLFHNYSSGVWGKGGEQFAQVTHERKWSEQLLNNVYEDFLSQEEIKALLDNRDLWLSTDDVVERMNTRIAKREALAKLEEDTRPE